MKDAIAAAKERMLSDWGKAVEAQKPKPHDPHRDEPDRHYRYDHTEKGIASNRARGARYRAKPEKRALKSAYRKEYYAKNRERELARSRALSLCRTASLLLLRNATLLQLLQQAETFEAGAINAPCLFTQKRRSKAPFCFIHVIT